MDTTLHSGATSTLHNIAMAHSRVRNAFKIPQMEEITAKNERLLELVFSEEGVSRTEGTLFI